MRYTSTLGIVATRPKLVLVAASLAVAACGKGRASSTSAGPTTSATPAPRSSSIEAPSAPSASASAPPSSSAANAPASAPPVADFAAVKATKECKAASYDMVQYQPYGQLTLAGRDGSAGAAWLVQLAGKKEAQIAFAAYDGDARQTAPPRGVGLAAHPARIFPTGNEFTVTWFDDRGLAYARPHQAPLPAPEIQHLPAVGPDIEDDVALNVAAGGSLIAAAPFGAGKEQLGLFLFAPSDPGAPAVKALGVTHRAKSPHKPAVANDATGTYLAWREGDRIAATHFDPAGKEGDASCEIAPAAPARDRLAIVAATGGAIAVWGEGDAIKSRALDAHGCPSSPIFVVGQGKMPQLVASPDGAIVAWVGTEGHLLAARLGTNAAPASKGLDLADGPVKDVPGVAVLGARTAFAWSEPMSAIVASKRLVLRTVESACF